MGFSDTTYTLGTAEGGQTLVEFAFIMPMLILLIGTIIMIALGLHTRSNLQQAVREGARQAAVGKSLSDVQDLAAGNSGGSLDSDEVDWCLPAGSSGSVGDEIRVYIDEGGDGSEGYAFVLIPAGNGIFSAMGSTRCRSIWRRVRRRGLKNRFREYRHAVRE